MRTSWLLGTVSAGFLILASITALSAASETACRQISLRGSLQAGEPFASKIGGGLELRLTPTRFSDPSVATPLDGWRIELVPAKPTLRLPEVEDRIYPVNPPLRFNPSQDIGTSYGTTAEQKLQHPILYAFVPDDESFRRISQLATDALWPYSARDPTHATEAYLTALGALTLGTILFIPTQYRTTEGGRSITEMAFLVEVIAPKQFAFAQADPQSVSCPPRQH